MATEVTPNAASCANSNNIGSLLNSLADKKRVHETYIFKLENVVTIKLANVDLDYASRGTKGTPVVRFIATNSPVCAGFTDADINKTRGDQRDSVERDLVPWDDDGDVEEQLTLDDECKRNGWNAEDMFTFNKTNNKVKSDFDGNNIEGVYT